MIILWNIISDTYNLLRDLEPRRIRTPLGTPPI